MNHRIIPRINSIKDSKNIFCKDINTKMNFHEISESICKDFEGQIGQFFELGETKNNMGLDWLEYSDIYHAYFKVSKNYLYLMLHANNGQSGSLGIYDRLLKDWIFTHNDECFLINADGVEFIDGGFHGRYFWSFPMVDVSGDGKFSIHLNNKSQWKIKKTILNSRSPYKKINNAE